MSRLSISQLVTAFYRSACHEGRFLREHRWDFAMVFWMPLMLIVSIWWIFSRGMIVDLPIGVIDNNHSQQSATLVRYIDAAPEVAVTQEFSDSEQAMQALRTMQVYGVVVIPSDFGRKLNEGQPTRVLFNVNAQFGTHSGILQKGVQSAVATLSAGAEMKGRIARGEAITQVTTSYAPIQTQAISLFNISNNYQQFLAGTIIPALLHILSMVIGCSTVGRELRDRTLGDWYQSLLPQSKGVPALSDSHSFWFIAAALNGKLIWAMLAYTLWGALSFTLDASIKTVSIASFVVTYGCFLLFMMVSFWMGAILTLGTYSYRQGLSFTGFISAPSFAFSGVTFPFLAMTPAAQRWANGLPLTHYLRVQIPQLEMNAPVALALPYVAGFAVAVTVCLLLTAKLTRKALQHPEKWGQR